MTRRILTEINLTKIAVVDAPCQERAEAMIMKGKSPAFTKTAPINTKAQPDPEDDQTVDPSGVADGSRRFRHLRKDQSSMKAINEVLAKIRKGGVVTKTDVHAIFLEKAAGIREANPKLTPAQTFAKAYQDPANAELRKAYMGAPNTAEVSQAVVKRKEPENLGWRCLQAKAAEVRKGDPKLTAEQAFAKAYVDPANSDFVRIHNQAVAA